MRIRYIAKYGTYKKHKLKTLIVGREYEVLEEWSKDYKIRNSLNKIWWYRKDNFEVVK